MLNEPVVQQIKPETAYDHRQIELMDNFHQTRTLPALRNFEVNVNTALREQKSYFEGLLKSTDTHLRDTERNAQEVVKQATQEMQQVGKQLTDFIASAQGTFGKLTESDVRHDQQIAAQERRLATLEDRLDQHRRETEAKMSGQQREIDLLISSQADMVRTVKGEPGNPSLIFQMNEKIDKMNQQVGEVNTRLAKIETRQSWMQALFNGPEMFWKNPLFLIALIVTVVFIIDIFMRLPR